jgi:hypothetical protein
MSADPYRASAPFKFLLHRFGEVAATTSFYASTRAPGPVERPGENLPLTELEQGEPALIVKISADGGWRIDKACDVDGVINDHVQVMELPEDEFWFFEAFRPAVSRLSIGAPGFVYEMAIISLYAVFDAYLADVLRARLRRWPRLISARARRSAEIPSTAESLDQAIDLDVRRLTYGSISALLARLRGDLEMTTLTAEYDQAAQTLAFVRNCLMHAGGVVDRRLADADAAYVIGERLQVTDADLSASMKTLRDLTLAIDRADQLEPDPSLSTG